MNFDEIVCKIIKGNSSRVVFDLFAKIRLKAACSFHVCAYRSVLPFHKRCADMLHGGISRQLIGLDSQPIRSPEYRVHVPALRTLKRVQHRVINISAKGIFYSLQIGPVRIGCNLHPMTQAGSLRSAHKPPCSASISAAQHPCGNQSRICANGSPQPHIASSRILF